MANTGQVNNVSYVTHRSVIPDPVKQTIVELTAL